MLSRAVLPRVYRLELEPSVALDTFRGSLTVELECSEDVSSFVLNAHSSLTLSVVLVDGVACAVKSSEQEELVVMLPAPGRPKVLFVSYVGTIGGDSIGLYRNTFSDKPGLATQLFSTYARRMFPCWDEPAFKAVFHISVILDNAAFAGADVRSNAPLARKVEVESNRSCRQFEPTPIMSAYLVALFVGHCSLVTKRTRRHGKPISILAPIGQEETAEFAATVAAKSVDFFEDFFGVDLPVEKVDLAGLQSFLYGGMENWGLIYFQSYILYIAKNATHSQRRLCSSVVCHEIAHNWFGNLVTIDWWHSLWLSEGFATFAGWLAVEDQFPEWDVPALLFLEELERGLAQDSNKSTHAVEIDSSIRDPQAVMALIDSISYCKGMACVMIAQDFLGKESFQTQMGKYLKKYAFSNARTDQLWEELGLGAEMRHWVRAMGHPVVTATRAMDGNSIHLKQERFFANGDVEAGASEPWSMNLNAVTRDGGRKKIRFEKLEDTIADDGVALFWGVFCRVSYCDALFGNLLANVATFNSFELLQLIDGQVALARSARGNGGRVLDLIESIWSAMKLNKLSVEPLVADGLLSAMGTLTNAFSTEIRLAEYRKRLAAFFLSIQSEKETMGDVHQTCRSLAFDASLYEDKFAQWQLCENPELQFVFRAAALKAENFDILLAISRDPSRGANIQRTASTQLAAYTPDKKKLEETLLKTSSGLFRSMLLSIRDYAFLESFLDRHWSSFIFPTCGGTVSVSDIWTHSMGKKSVDDIGATFALLTTDQQNLMRAKVDSHIEFLQQRSNWSARDLPLVTRFFDTLKE